MENDALLQMASITTDMFNETFRFGLEEKLRLFARCGFRYVHWCDDWDNERVYTKEDIQLYCDTVESAGLKCIDVHGAETEVVHVAAEGQKAFDRYVRLLENRIEFCAAIGGDAVVIHPPDDGADHRPLAQKLERSLQAFERVRPLCEDLSVALAVENCKPSDEKILEYYFERYPQEFVGFCFDSGHAHLHGNLDELFKFGSRLNALHLHDNRGKEDDHQPPFWGTIDWKRVMGWIDRSNYRKPVNFEISHRSRLFHGTMEEFLDCSVLSVQKALALIGSWSASRPVLTEKPIGEAHPSRIQGIAMNCPNCGKAMDEGYLVMNALVWSVKWSPNEVSWGVGEGAQVAVENGSRADRCPSCGILVLAAPTKQEKKRPDAFSDLTLRRKSRT